MIGSRGSVVPLFLKEKQNGLIPITDERMTRFWISIDDGVRFVNDSLKIMKGGEIFIPKIPSMKIIDLAKAIAPECKFKVIGIRPGEKVHETMVSSDDASKTIEFDDKFIICPEKELALNIDYIKYNNLKGKKVNDQFVYSSELNKDWLTVEKLKKMIK